ncbi:hypothetical protein JCM5353_007621 [Sporobolomyces roseus]
MFSASVISPSSSQSGGCVVCGKETAIWCSECATNGTESMFFCSREHQKLVWFTHKRVCGKRSNPFRFPALTDKEVDEMVELSTLPMMVAGLGMMKWVDMFAMKSAIPDVPGLRAYNFRGNLESLREDGPNEMLDLDETSAVMGNRRTAQIYRAGIEPFEAARSAICSHPFDVMACTLTKLKIPELKIPELLDPTSYPWWSNLMHRYLLFTSFLVLGGRSTAFRQQTRDYLVYTLKELKLLIINTIYFSHAGIGMALLSTLISDDVAADASLPLFQIETRGTF